MRKQGRSGVVKTWKTRYFVLNAGILYYYTEEIEEFPFGTGLKGELSLSNAEIVEESKRYNEKQIYIVSYSGENNILIEAESVEDSVSWLEALQLHLAYANRDAEETVLNPSRASSRRAKAQSGNFDEFALIRETESNKPASRRVSFIRKSVSVSSSGESVQTVVTVDIPDVPLPGDVAQLVVSTLKRFYTDTMVDAGQRNLFVVGVLRRFSSTLAAFISAFSKGGKIGQRGEEFLLGQLFICTCVFRDLQPWVRVLVEALVQMCGFSLTLVGFFLMLRSLWELNEGASPLLRPVKTPPPTAAPTRSAAMSVNESVNKSVEKGKEGVPIEEEPRHHLVMTGPYRLLRHPMFGGVVLMAFGVSCWALRFDKLFFSIVLLFALNKISDKEEVHLVKEHPQVYENYREGRSKLIPFLF